jgi:hypothetical protein
MSLWWICIFVCVYTCSGVWWRLILLFWYVNVSRVNIFLDKPQQTPNPRVVDAHLIILFGTFYPFAYSHFCVTSLQFLDKPQTPDWLTHIWSYCWVCFILLFLLVHVSRVMFITLFCMFMRHEYCFITLFGMFMCHEVTFF